MLNAQQISYCFIRLGLLSSVMWRGLCWSLFTDVSGSPSFPSLRVKQSDPLKISLLHTISIFPLLRDYAVHVPVHEHLKLGLRIIVNLPVLRWERGLNWMVPPPLTRWCSWLRHCATSRKVTCLIPDGVIGIFHWHNPSGRTMALGSTQHLTEMSTRNISWR